MDSDVKNGKFIYDGGSNAAVLSLLGEMETLIADCMQEEMFIRKRAEALEERAKKSKDEIWGRVQKILISEGVLAADWNKTGDMNIHRNDFNQLILYKMTERNPFSDMLRDLLKR